MQRAIEAAGIPTVAIANLRDRVERVMYPRAVIVKFPRGATVGAPEDAALQTQVLRDALDWLESASQPGAFLDLPHRWPGTRKAS
ncbi:MAG: hypothetical protein V3S64_09885 [bacterium]